MCLSDKERKDKSNENYFRSREVSINDSFKDEIDHENSVHLKI